MTACRLHEAAKANRVKELEKLLDQGYHVDLVEGGFTALYLAVEAGHMNSVQFLLARKANPNARCLGGATAVHVACLRGSPSVLQQLVQCGGDLRLRDDEGRTPCEWARECVDPMARSRVIELVLRKRSDAYRLVEKYVDDKLPTADNCALLKRRLSSGTQRRKWCTERLVTDSGFGPVYQWASEVGVPTHISYVSPGLLLHADEPRTTWSGPMSVMQTMYRDTLRVTVKRSTVNKRVRKSVRSDVILQEIENLRRLSWHPAYLWPVAISPTENMEDAFIVYEAIHFGTLFKVLHDDSTPTLPTDNLIQMLRQICEAVLFLHESGYVHACLNPHAIAVISPTFAKLTGFEFLQDERSQPNDCRKFTIGDRSVQEYYFHWLAPEVLSNGSAKQSSDLYSLATVIWEAFTKLVPWCNEDLDSVYQNMVVHKRGLQITGTLPVDLEGVVRAALMPGITQRQTSLEEIYHELSALMAVGSHDAEPWPSMHNRRITTLLSRQSSQLNKSKTQDISMRSSFRTPPPYIDESENPSPYAGDTFETANMSEHMTMDFPGQPLHAGRKSTTLMSTPKRPDSVSSVGSDTSTTSHDMRQARKAEGIAKARLAKLTSAFVSSAKFISGSPKKTSPPRTNPVGSIRACLEPQTVPSTELTASGLRGQVPPPVVDQSQKFLSIHQKFASHFKADDVASNKNSSNTNNNNSNNPQSKRFLPVDRKFSHAGYMCWSPARVEKSLRFEKDEESMSDNETSGPAEKDPETGQGDYERILSPHIAVQEEAVYARVGKQLKAASAPPVPMRCAIDEVDGLGDRLQAVAVAPPPAVKEEINVADGPSRKKTGAEVRARQEAAKVLRPEVKPIRVERNRKYKLEVITDSEPAVRHHIRIMEINRETGETRVTEEVSVNPTVSFEFMSASSTSDSSAEENGQVAIQRATEQSRVLAHALTPESMRAEITSFLDCLEEEVPVVTFARQSAG
ncbi:inactive serine/threonine-protein kinase TEX14-like [Tropilaelaps mercedesae]|uniref:Inactive serine/threonine-protein kinase TEX14-like n=1 Tax=Tropilaelaps mercedesae TaxID=418985 RepID=A0A1V9WYZ2_9ACAR|nr:inactive serine/threonine-protein kinase TEX14-like [Tropilaelaps mercedesae]